MHLAQSYKVIDKHLSIIDVDKRSIAFSSHCANSVFFFQQVNHFIPSYTIVLIAFTQAFSYFSTTFPTQNETIPINTYIYRLLWVSLVAAYITRYLLTL